MLLIFAQLVVLQALLSLSGDLFLPRQVHYPPGDQASFRLAIGDPHHVVRLGLRADLGVFQRQSDFCAAQRVRP